MTTTSEPTFVDVPAEAPAPSAHEALVNAWLVDWFHNAQLPTPLQNRLAEAAQDLTKRLDAAKE